MKVLITLALVLLLSACSDMQFRRNPASGYAGYNDRNYGETSLADLAEKDRQMQRVTPELKRLIPKPETPAQKQKFQRAVANVVEQNDIAVGMDMNAVMESWGAPENVYVTGEEKHKNQMWRYTVPIQTATDYNIEERNVYFQNGKVAGWKSK